jgi:integrase
MEVTGCYQHSWGLVTSKILHFSPMASLTKKSRSKYWFACFRDLQGKQRRLSTKQTDRKKAMKVAEQYEQVSQCKLPVHNVRQTLTALAREAYGETFPSATVRQFTEARLKGKAPPVVAQSTHDFYRKSAKKFLEFLGTAAELDLSAMTRKMMIEFRNQVAQKASATTTNHDLKAIKLIFRSAKRDGYIIEDPSEFVESVRRKTSDDARRPFTVPEIRKVIEVADKEWKSLVLFALYTGQRLADLATLRWDNIDLVRNEIRIQTRKTGKRLAIPIAPPLKTHIESLPAAREGYLHPKAAVIVTSQKRSGTLSNQFANLLAQAGLRDKAPHRSRGKGRDAKRSSNGLSFHALRHTAVSLLKDAGIPEAVVMELVGHDSEAMSAHYTHVGTEALAKAVAALPEI